MTSPLCATLRLFTAVSVLSSFVFYYSIDKLVMELRGLSATEIVLVEIVYSLLVIVMEVPTGVLSDRWSRRYVLALHFVFFSLSTFLWAVAESVSIFMLGAAMASVHSALRSGTESSYLYDLLSEQGRGEEFSLVYGRVLFWSSALSVPAAIIGAWLASRYGLSLPFWLTIPFSLLGALLALCLTELHRHCPSETIHWRHVLDTGRYCLTSQGVLRAALALTVLGAPLTLLHEYVQLLFSERGVPVGFFGALTAASSAVQAAGGLIAAMLARRGCSALLGAAAPLSAFGYLAMGSTVASVAVPASFLPLIIYYSVSPLLLGELHRELPTDRRATAESLVNVVLKLTVVPLALAFGIASDRFSVRTAFFAIGVLMMVVATLRRGSKSHARRP